MSKIAFLFIFFIYSFNSYSNRLDLCPQSIESLPIQQQGRTKPLLVHSNEVLKFLTGRTSQKELSSVQVYCLLSLQGVGIKNNLQLETKIEHVKLQEFLSLDGAKLKLDDLLDQVDDLRRESMLNKTKDPNGAYQKDLEKAIAKANIYSDIINGNNWFLAVSGAIQNDSSKVVWLTLKTLLSPKVMELMSKNNYSDILKLYERSKLDHFNIHGDDYLQELTFTKLNLFRWSLLLGILALASFLTFKNPRTGVILTVLVIIVEITGVTFRTLISGRAPVTNMYETVLFSGLGGLILALAIYAYRKEKMFLLSGHFYNVLCLFMMNFANNMLDSSIKPLVPVLRDNFWLSTHVTSVVLSYGALALSWCLANFLLIKTNFTSMKKSDYNYNLDLMYTCMKYGVVLLAAGIILGGVWADYSWGRFWGWDPKETWSLIVLVCYVVIFHGRFTKWITNKNFASYTAFAFLSVIMAWFGVNYILASGLHSYGFSQGGAIFISLVFLVQILILIFTRNHYKKVS